jgi:hypothetical protein
MGPRQLGFMRRALTEVYTDAGVLFHGRESFLTADEADALGSQPGLSVHNLLPEQQQALAVLRSKKVSILDWMKVLRQYFAGPGKGDQSSRTSLEGVLLRLEQFEEGQMLQQYGLGADSLAIEDLGLLGDPDDAWGIAVIEGGAEMDDFVKAALFSLLATVLYYDAVVRRRESLAGGRFPVMDIFFEEANKVLSGFSSGSASDTVRGRIKRGDLSSSG